MPLQGGLGGSSLGGALGGGAGLQPFDTGLARPQRTLIRQHLAAALAPLLKANGGYLSGSIWSLPQPLRSQEDCEYLYKAILGYTPAIAIALGGKSLERIGLDATEIRGKIEIAVYVVCANARGLVLGRLEQDVGAGSDPTADPGGETILEHVAQLISGQELNLAGTNELQAEGEEPLYTFDEYSVWSQTYYAYVDNDANPDRDISAVVTSVDVQSTPDGVAAELATGVPSLTETVTTLEVPSP